MRFTMALNWYRALYFFADAVFNLFVIFPLIVAYWSGSWNILDRYTTPAGDNVFSSWLSLIIGCFIGILSYFILPTLKDRIDPTCNVKHIIISRTFIYINAWGIIFFWRGVWNFVDHLLGDSVMTAGILLGLSYFVLILMKGTTNVIGPPYAAYLDTTEDFYVTYPRFRTQLLESPFLYLLDTIFSVIVLQGMCVLVWVGLWNVFDAIILPDDKVTSYIVSLVAGYASAAFLFLLQYPVFLIAAKLYQKGKIYELLFEFFINAVASVTVLLLWRGGWGMVKDYVLTAKWRWDCWLFHGLGAAGLMLCQVGVLLGGVGCGVDGEKGGGYDVVWPIDYFWQLCGAGRNTYQSVNIQDSDGEEEGPLLEANEQGLLGPGSYTSYNSIPVAADT